MARLSYILNDTAAEGQLGFRMEAIPGRHMQVIVDGRTLAPGEYTVNESLLTLQQAPPTGARVLVISGQGGTFVSGEYVQSLAGGLATKSELELALANKVDRNDDIILPRDPIDPLGAATKQMVDSIIPGAPVSYVDEKLALYMPRTEVQPALDGKINTNLMGQPNGVARLGPDSKLLEFQLPNIAISEIYPANSEAEMLDLADNLESGDVVRRLDLSPRRSYMRNRVLAEATSTVDDLFVELTDPTGMNAIDINVDPTGNLGSTDVQGALSELQSDINGTDTRVTTAEGLITGLRTDLDADVTNLSSHAGLVVDPTSAETTRNKHVSNADIKVAYDTQQGLTTTQQDLANTQQAFNDHNTKAAHDALGIDAASVAAAGVGTPAIDMTVAGVVDLNNLPEFDGYWVGPCDGTIANMPTQLSGSHLWVYVQQIVRDNLWRVQVATDLDGHAVQIRTMRNGVWQGWSQRPSFYYLERNRTVAYGIAHATWTIGYLNSAIVADASNGYITYNTTTQGWEVSTTGIYLLWLQGGWVSNNTGERLVRFNVSGVADLGYWRVGASYNSDFSTIAIVRIPTGSVILPYLYQSCGAALNISYLRMSVTKIASSL